MPFHEMPREANRAAWDAMQTHPFVRAIEEGRLAPDAFLRYLAYERDFVGAAIEIFALALIKAPGFSAQDHLIGVLRALTAEQTPYFDATFAALGTAPPPSESFPSSVVAFRDRMLEIARSGTYAEILTAMLAAEWMYATWCARAATRPITDPYIARWLAIHIAPEFTAGLAWLKQSVNEEAAGAGEAVKPLLVRRFGEALALEVGFHAAALSSPNS